MPTILFSSHNKPLITNMAENSFKPDINANMTPNTDNKEQIDPIKMLDMAEKVIEKIEQNLHQTK